MNRNLRIRRHRSLRKRVLGSETRPRLSVFRSSKHIYAQIIDDNKAKTLTSVSDKNENGTKKDKAYKVGKALADKASKQKIKKVVFDRGGFLYHGRIAELAKGAREGGLEF